MVTSIIPEINSAMDHPDPRRAVERVKDVIQRHLLRAYPQADIIRTEFFNHTYVPDLLMTWPSGSQRAERRVYLRASSEPSLLTSDIMLFEREHHPLVVPLGQVSDGRARAELEGVAGDQNTLILDPTGLGALPPQNSAGPTTTLASRAIVEGGRGIMGQGQVEHFLSAVESGVAAAREGVPEPTRAALAEVALKTVPAVSRRMATFMAAMWQGSGRSLAEFPGESVQAGSLDEGSLALLLTSPEITDESFWKRIRSLVDVRTLLSTDIQDTVNLQHLMRSVIQDWKAHVCMVTDSPQSLPNAGRSWRWSIDNGRLGLIGPGFIAYLAGSRKDLDLYREYPVPLLAEVRSRANRFSIPVTSIRMLVANRSVGYDAPGEDVTRDPQLDGISAALGQEVGVVEAHALTPSGNSLRCSFGTRTASPLGARVLLPYAELLGITLRLLFDLGIEDAEKLHNLLNAGEPSQVRWSQPDLFEQSELSGDQ